MRWNGFSSSLVFGVLAALGLMPAVTLMTPHLGRTGALMAFMVTVMTVYAAVPVGRAAWEPRVSVIFSVMYLATYSAAVAGVAEAGRRYFAARISVMS